MLKILGTGIFLCVSSCAMDWNGDVLLKDIFNNSGQTVLVEIVNQKGKVLEKAEFDSQKDVPQSWVNRIHSKKMSAPDMIQIKQRNYVYTPTGNIKELDIIIEKDAIREIPSGSKLHLVADEEPSLILKQMARPGVSYKTVLIVKVTNNSKNLVTINTHNGHQNVINPQSSKIVNEEVEKNRPLIIKTATHHFTYMPTGKVEKLQIMVDQKGMATLSEYLS